MTRNNSGQVGGRAAVGVFLGDRGLTEAQGVRRTGGEIGFWRATTSGHIPPSCFYGEDNKPNKRRLRGASFCRGHDIIRSRAGHEREQDSTLTTNPRNIVRQRPAPEILAWSKPPLTERATIH